MPSVVMELRKYLNDPDVSFDRLAKLIEVDPGLTVNVLQLANSAYFGWTRTISSVKDAITRLLSGSQPARKADMSKAFADDDALEHRLDALYADSVRVPLHPRDLAIASSAAAHAT